MDDVSRRLASLSPQQRRLFELRLKKHGLAALTEQESPAANTIMQSDEGVREEEDFNRWGKATLTRGIEFSLYFFSDDGAKTTQDKYRLLLESAKFADAQGFCAVWTPERHFQDFGGLFPNPSVLAAALSMITKRIQIRAGSVVAPLHHPIRIAEEWSVVDNLSDGRVELSFASGYHPGDFMLD